MVTVLSGWKSSFFFQDATSGISVDRTNDSPQLQPGQVIEIKGVTGPGMFAPVVIASRVTVLGDGTFPPARLFAFDKLTGGQQDSQWMAIRGIVRSAVEKGSWGRSVLFLEVDIGGGNLVTVRVHDFSETGWRGLPGATVIIRGVCGTVFNDERQFVGLRLFVASLGDVKVEQPAPADPFNIPVRPLGSLLQFGDREGVISRVKLRGVLTYSHPGVGLYLEDGTQGVFVQSNQTTPVALGSHLEVVGYPAVGRYSPKLVDAIYRVVGSGKPLAPIPQAASRMVLEKDGFTSAPFDSVLVQITGQLVEQIPGPDEDLFLFRDRDSLFSARLLRSEGSRSALATGSLLSVTGICAAYADEAHEARSFEILLRTPADLVLLKKASWWTASHAGWVVALLILVVLGMAGWVAVDRHQARLRALTVTDSLTGLYNRRGFLLLAEQQWHIALRKKLPLLLFYIDIDHFKRVNDSLGHKEGDITLRAVAGLLRECFRKADTIGRLGGDEFAVMTFDTPDQSRTLLERRLARAIQQRNAKVARSLELALSVGILTCDASLADSSLEDLLEKADALMYEQKRNAKVVQ